MKILLPPDIRPVESYLGVTMFIASTRVQG
jgi:hypothetical protein